MHNNLDVFPAPLVVPAALTATHVIPVVLDSTWKLDNLFAKKSVVMAWNSSQIVTMETKLMVMAAAALAKLRKDGHAVEDLPKVKTDVKEDFQQFLP